MADSGEQSPPSYLVVETETMEKDRRLREQQGLRAQVQARVHERERGASEEASLGDEYAMESVLKQHPLLDGQQFDGIDVNPSDPNLSPAAREKVKEVKRKQELEKQLRLEQRLDLQMSNKPRYYSQFTPKPGGG